MGSPLPALLLILLLGTPSCGAICNVATPNECRQKKPVPGMELLGEGFDVVLLRGTGAWAVDTRSWQRRGSCTVCHNAHLKGEVQRLPRAVAHWVTETDCNFRLQSTVYDSAEELSASQSAGVDSSWSVGLDVKPRPNSAVRMTVAGERSEMASFGRKREATDRYSFSSQAMVCRLYRARLGTQPPLHPHFIQEIRRLPRRWDGRWDNGHGEGSGPGFFYRRFLRTFGTHYVHAVTLGGLFRDITALRTCQVAAEGQTAEEVKDCLTIEAEAQIGSKLDSNAKYRHCKEAQNKAEGRMSFHQTYNDRLTVVQGGLLSKGADLLFGGDEGGSSNHFKAWVSSLSSHPGVTYRTLEPLHLLLSRRDPRRAHLHRAISQYIVEGASEGHAANCSSKGCPRGGTRPSSARGSCSCRCSDDPWVNGQCCPKKKGWGRLEVKVIRCRDLWGDYTSGTDAYVRVSCGPGLKASTAAIANNNHPVWDVWLNLEEVQLGSGARLRLEVWDQDWGLDRDDLLGACEIPLVAGPSRVDLCYLNHGSLSYELRLTCGPHLGGDDCREYQSLPGS
ncbi:LOW QUALITY PROTEIN: perforin-1-like [Hemitrygon akajei]|uniref:LOW QUALITY PROTEIN: perforin-1-like n=1 Tax=Hemitrygon akajei TaxID=2704970 RepID=UPI003BF9AB67